MDSSLLSNLIVTGVLIAFAASANFNQPSWARTFTTAARYRYSLIAHIVAYQAVMLLIYAVLRRIVLIISRVSDVSPPLSVPDQVWIAFLLTLLLRATPPFARPLRALVHRIAGIPESALRFARHLSCDDFETTKASPFHAEAVQLLESRGITHPEEWPTVTQPVHRLLLRSTVLFLQMRTWDSDAKYGRFMLETRHEFDQLRRRFDRMSFRISRALASIERIGEASALQASGEVSAHAEEIDERFRMVVKDLVADCCEDLESFFEDACVLVARATLATRMTRKGRDQFVKALGFTHERERVPGALTVLGYLALVLYLVSWVYFTLMPAQDSDIGPSTLISVVTIITVGSIAVAIFPKLRWGFANSGLRERTPVPFVIGAGLSATLFAVGVNLAAGFVLAGGWGGAVTRLIVGSPILPFAFLTAACMAWLVQDHRWGPQYSPGRRRLFDAAMLGSAWVASSVLGHAMQAALAHHDANQERLAISMVVSLVVGGAVAAAIAEHVRVNDIRSVHRQPHPGSAMHDSAFPSLSR